jgi:hypothetical protein
MTIDYTHGSWRDRAGSQVLDPEDPHGEPLETSFHLHVHVIPRRDSDGLHLPWTGQQRGEKP